MTQLKSLLLSLPSAERRQWLLSVPLVLALAVVEGLVAAAILALLGMIVEPGQTDTLVGYPGAPGSAGAAGDSIRVLVSLGALILARSGLTAILTYTRSRATSETDAILSTRLLTRYVGESFMGHQRRDSAGIMRDVLDSTGAACATLAAVLSLTASTAIAIAVLLVVLANAPFAGFLAVLSVGGLAVLLVALLRRRASRWGADTRVLGRLLLGSLRDTLGVFKEIRLGGHEAAMLERFARLRHGLARVQFEHAFWAALPRPIIESLFLITALVVAIAGLARGSLSGEGLPLLGLYLYAGLRLLPTFQGLASQLIDIRVGLARAGPLLAELEGSAAPVSPDPGRRSLPWRRDITLEGIGFTYDGARGPALCGVSLVIPRDERVGIAGATGAGKSTLADLLTGLLTPDQGRILVDAEPLTGREQAWQRGIGYARMGTFLIDDTLRRNVALGVADGEVDEGRLTEALRVAQLDAVLRRLPAGAETRLGDGGTPLSAGESQRIGLARALYGRPALLIFDEAFSTLDQHTEARFFADLAEWLSDTTQVLVSHRPSTLARCRRVILLHEGRVEAIAAYDDLMADNPRFRELMSAGN